METIKAIARGFSLVAVVPLVISYHARAILVGRDRALEGSSQAIAGVPGIVGQYLRRALLSRLLAYCDPTAVIGYGTLFSSSAARIEKNVYVGPYSVLGMVHIQKDVLIGSGVHIPSGKHVHGSADLNIPIREQAGRRQLISIGAGAWVGDRAVVMADVGADCIIGAGSVVTGPIPPRMVAAGSPARVIRDRAEASSGKLSNQA
jgi:acetyltransferase-like isoleucine patch superfamily enzyme